LPKTPATFIAMKNANVFEDKDFRVRLAAVLATTDMKPSSEIGTTLLNMAEKEENVNDTWLKYALTIAAKINQQTFDAAFKKKGLNKNPSLMEASLPQRLAFGSRLSEMPLRRTYNMANKDALSPEVKNKEILVSGELTRNANAGSPLQGMVMAQGNMVDGYGLFMLDNTLHFQVNQNAKAYEIVTSGELPATFSFKAGIEKNGTMRLFIDNKEVDTAKAKGLFTKELQVPLRVGMETGKGNDRIAEYPDSTFFLRGNLEVRLETLDGISIAPKSVAKIDKVITLNAVKNVMKYDKKLITAKAGTTIQIVLKNPDFMQHNLVIIKPGSKEKVGAAADKQAQAGDATKVNYVPRTPDVLASTPLIDPNGRYTLTFKVPDTPGDYPYVCTFPGHWRMMSGILRVTR